MPIVISQSYKKKIKNTPMMKLPHPKITGK